jgi:hypothetical protein
MLSVKPIKRKSRTPKQKKVSKTKRVKKASTTVQEHQAGHYQPKQISTQGFFNPFTSNTSVAQSSIPPRPQYSSGGGIPYTSTLESFGVSNKPPYYLESLIAKDTQPKYTQPVQSSSSSVLVGSNPMNGGSSVITTTSFPTQGKSESVQYIDLVAPAKKGNGETQPDFILLNDMDDNIRATDNDNEILMIKDKTKKATRIKKEMNEQEKKPTAKPNRVQEIKESIEDRIKQNKERKTKIPQSSLRGQKNKDEL